jgi:hypothetical protein
VGCRSIGFRGDRRTTAAIPPSRGAPIRISKARAGALFGSRILMLEHIGRKSGAPRYAVLEIVDHPAPDVYIVASGFGRKAQWFSNVQAPVLEETLGAPITDTDSALPIVELRLD